MSNRLFVVGQFFTLDAFALRMICLLACIPSGGAVLLKVSGIMQMQTAILYTFLPGALLLTAAWASCKKNRYLAVSDSIAIGLFAGLLATLAYDLTRLPFLMLGRRVFMAINTYGVWIAEARQSSRITDVIGWSYHFSNGITFGIIYTLFMRDRHWLWAVLYACALESIALVSPFREIFSLSKNWEAIGLLYLGHVAYGIPLGLLTQHWEKTRSWLQSVPAAIRISALLLFVASLTSPIYSAEDIERDGRRQADTFTVEGKTLNPDLVRIQHGERLTLYNPSERTVVITIKNLNKTLTVAPGQRAQVSIPHEGIYQIFVETEGRTRSSFIITELVENLKTHERRAL